MLKYVLEIIEFSAWDNFKKFSLFRAARKGSFDIVLYVCMVFPFHGGPKAFYSQ